MNINTNEFILAILILLSMLYAHLGIFNIPKWLVLLFNNDLCKILLLFLIVIIHTNISPHIAMIVSIFFVGILQYLNSIEISEKMTNLKKITKSFSEHKIELKKIN
jgi:hypothetical protein